MCLKLLDEWQTVKTLIRRHIFRRTGKTLTNLCWNIGQGVLSGGQVEYIIWRKTRHPVSRGLISLYGPKREKTYLLRWSPKEDSNPLCIRAVWSEFLLPARRHFVSLAIQKSAQWRFWSDCANAQADLNLRWTHKSKVLFLTLRSIYVLSLNIWQLIHKLILTNHSNKTRAIPAAAPAPAKPTKCSLPILLENKDAPTWNLKGVSSQNAAHTVQNFTLLALYTGAVRPEPTVWTQIRRRRKRGLIWVYTVCHSSSSCLDTSRGRKMDMFKA